MLVDIFENATKTMVWRDEDGDDALLLLFCLGNSQFSIYYWNVGNFIGQIMLDGGFFFMCAQRYSDMGSNITAINNLRSTKRYCASEQHRIKSILPWHRMQCKIAQKYDKTENSSRKIKRKPVPYERNRSYLAWPLAKYKYKHASYAICPEQTQIQVNVDL